MKNTILKIITTIFAFIGVIVVFVWLVGGAFDKEGKVHCLDLQSQAVEFGRTYSKWAEENPTAHEKDVEFCKHYDVEIVLHY